MFELSGRTIAAAVFVVAGAIAILVAVAQPINNYAQSADGLTIYLGVVPAQIVKGDRAMHGGAPKGPHEYHIVAAVFDAASGARVSDATVTAKVSGLGLSGSESKLEPMRIADTTTYGAFVYLPGADLYTIRLTTLRAGMTRPAVTEFKYDHRRQ